MHTDTQTCSSETKKLFKNRKTTRKRIEIWGWRGGKESHVSATLATDFTV